MLFFYGMRRYGKKNATSRFGVCEACGSEGILETYDTAQFLHLYWIPLIPVGHIKVIDACPHCNKCRTISLRKFKKLKQTNEATLLARLRETPDDPNLACEALGHWSSYQDQANFKKMASLYQSRMQHNPQVMKAIARGYYRLGHFTEVLETARRLPDSDPDRSTIMEEAEAHLDVEVKETRKAKPAGIPILLPYLVPLLLILSVLGSYLGKGFTAGKYREVWLVNGSQSPYTVKIDGSPYMLSSYAQRLITLPMGKHNVRIENAPLACEPFSFEYDLSFTQRINDNKLLVLNPDGLAFMVTTYVPYIANGSSRTAEPRYDYAFGKKWHVLDKVDYPFRESPQNIDMPSGQTVTYKTELSLFEPVTYDDLFNTLYECGDVHDFAPFADALLRLQPDISDPSWMLGVVLGTNDIDSLELLNQGLAVRPVLIEWHRFYQNCKERMEPDYDLITEYQALLDAEPDEPALKYLRGRVEPDFEKSIALFTSSEQGGGCHGYGYYAIAYNLMCRMQFDKAFEYARKAMKQEGSEKRFGTLHGSSCLATRQYQPLIDSIRKKKVLDPDDGELVALEIRYLQLAGRADETQTAESSYLKYTAEWMEPETREQWENYFDSARCYANGDIDAYLAKLESVLPEKAEYQRALHKGDAQKALDMLKTDEVSDFSTYLTVYGTAMHNGQTKVADQALQTAIEKLEFRSDVKEYLTGENHPTPDLLTNAEFLPEEKILIASTLGYLHPDQQAEFFKLSEACNFSPFFPQLLIKSWLEQP